MNEVNRIKPSTSNSIESKLEEGDYSPNYDIKYKDYPIKPRLEPSLTVVFLITIFLMIISILHIVNYIIYNTSNSKMIMNSIIILISILFLIINNIILFIINIFYPESYQFQNNSNSNIITRRRLESIQCIGVIVSVGLLLLMRIINNNCNDGASISNIIEDLNCNNSEAAAMIPIDTAIVLSALPTILSYLYPLISLRIITVSYLLAVAFLVASLIITKAWNSLFTIILLIIFSASSLHYISVLSMEVVSLKLQQLQFAFQVTEDNKERTLSSHAQAKEAADMTAKEMRFMIANLAHDLNTPLSAFLCGAQLMARIIEDTENRLHMSFAAQDRLMSPILSPGSRDENDEIHTTNNSKGSTIKIKDGESMVLEDLSMSKSPRMSNHSSPYKASTHLNQLAVAMLEASSNDVCTKKDNGNVLVPEISLKKVSHEQKEIELMLAAQRNVKESIENDVQAMSSCLANIMVYYKFMLMIVNRCLDFTKASQDIELVAKSETFYLEDALIEPIDCMREIQPITIELQPIPSTIHAIITSDSKWLHDNVLCLVSNAVKFSTHGPVIVSVLISNTPNNGRQGRNKKHKKLNKKSPVLIEWLSSGFNRESNSNIDVRMELERSPINESKPAISSDNNSNAHSNNLGAHSDSYPVNMYRTKLSPIQSPDADRGSPTFHVDRTPDTKLSPRKLPPIGSPGSKLGSAFSHESTQAKSPQHHYISVNNNSNQQQFLIIQVEDHGVKLNTEEKRSLFTVNRPDKRMTGGAGLGLYCLSKRVQALGGDYGMEDRTDGTPGCLFWFSIPYIPVIEYDKRFSQSDEGTIKTTNNSLPSHQPFSVGGDKRLIGEFHEIGCQIKGPTSSDGSMQSEPKQTYATVKSYMPLTRRSRSRSGSVQLDASMLSMSPDGYRHLESPLLQRSGGLPPLRVLVVDTSPLVLNAISLLLRHYDHAVEVASSGQDAILKVFDPISLSGTAGLDISRSIDIFNKSGSRRSESHSSRKGSAYLRNSFNGMQSCEFDVILIDLNLHNGATNTADSAWSAFDTARRIRAMEENNLLPEEQSSPRSSNNNSVVNHDQVLDNANATRHASTPSTIRSTSNKKGVVLIGMTVDVTSVAIENALASGMEGVLSKPFQLEEFTNILSKLRQRFAPRVRVHSRQHSIDMSVNANEIDTKKNVVSNSDWNEVPQLVLPSASNEPNNTESSILPANATETSQETSKNNVNYNAEATLHHQSTLNSINENSSAAISENTIKNNKLVSRRGSQDLHPSYKLPMSLETVSGRSHRTVEVPKLNILVVDDAHVIIKGVSMLLKRNNHNVDTADNGKNALKKMLQRYKATDNSNYYDVVLMDVQMPEMDGYESTRRLREFEKSKDLSDLQKRWTITRNFQQNIVLDLLAQYAGPDNHDVLSPEIMESIDDKIKELSLDNDNKNEIEFMNTLLTDNNNWEELVKTKCQFLINNNKSQLIIGMSANSNAITRKGAVVSGVNTFIPKPFDINTFNSAVMKHQHLLISK